MYLYVNIFFDQFFFAQKSKITGRARLVKFFDLCVSTNSSPYKGFELKRTIKEDKVIIYFEDEKIAK